MQKYGVMQGRLLPKFKGNYQAHPIDDWEKEFELAKDLNLYCIEFIFDYHLYANNPLLNNTKYIKEIIDKTNVKVKSVCADFFMEAPIQYASKNEIYIFEEILYKLITNLNIIGGNNIVIPFVDKSSLKTFKDKLKIVDFLERFSDICKEKSVTLSLETDLNPNQFSNFIKLFKNDHVTINYDSGNSAALGYSFEEEINSYGKKISNIHIKDRVINGESVYLGKGNTNLLKLKEFIENSNYSGLLIFQAYRDYFGFNIFQDQLKYFLNL